MAARIGKTTMVAAYHCGDKSPSRFHSFFKTGSMMTSRFSTFSRRVLLAGVACAALSAAAQSKKEVTFAHQDMMVPLRTVMESGELEKATG
ncbi:MAG: hypothetical protein ORN28_12185, partial [Rhodoferax sp.]|nr:hypothetical protein [Rhodoferax sp.]